MCDIHGCLKVQTPQYFFGLDSHPHIQLLLGAFSKRLPEATVVFVCPAGIKYSQWTDFCEIYYL